MNAIESCSRAHRRRRVVAFSAKNCSSLYENVGANVNIEFPVPRSLRLNIRVNKRSVFHFVFLVFLLILNSRLARTCRSELLSLSRVISYICVNLASKREEPLL